MGETAITTASSSRHVDTSNEHKPRVARSRLHAFYRGSLFNAIMVGLVSFTQPGIWDALTSMGAGGLATPFFANAASVITYAIMVVLCPVFAVSSTRWNLKWTLVIGTLGYAPWSASLYTNSKYGTQWFMLFGAVLCGISAAAFWVSEAAIAVGYPEEHRKGMYIAIWYTLNKVGSIVGSSVQLGFNIGNSQKGAISPETYLILIALQCLGLPMALLVSPIHKLIRTDGTQPIRAPRTTITGGFKSFWRVCKRPEIAALVPLFITSHWANTYEGNYLTTYFTVRGRSLSAFIVTWIGIITNLLFGWILDNTLLIRRRSVRAKLSWLLVFATFSATYIYNIVLQVDYDSAKPTPTFDITTPGFGRAVAVYCLFNVASNAFPIWGYWVLSSFDDSIENITYSTSLLRTGESLASAISYGLGASKNVSLLTNLLIAAVLFWVSVPTTTWSTWKVTDVDVGVGVRVDGDEDASGGGSTSGGGDGVKQVGEVTKDVSQK